MPLHKVTQESIGPVHIDWSHISHRFMNPGELEILVALFRDVQPRGVLEFGVNAGRTARVILDMVPGIQHYEGIDVPPGFVTDKAVQRKEVPIHAAHMVEGDKRFRLLLPARGSADLLPADLSPCDAVFIDGDHSRHGVEYDSMLAHAVCRPGGIIVWHDYHDLGTVDVREVINEFAAHHELFHVDNTWLVYQRV